jgi:osmotically-inducible protein OsmY
VQQFEHGNTFAGRGPRGYRRSDDRIREDVCDLLTDDWRIDASDVEVTVQNGEVTLSGTVHNRDEKRTTEDLVETISGVREVHNQLRTTGSLPAPVG